MIWSWVNSGTRLLINWIHLVAKKRDNHSSCLRFSLLWSLNNNASRMFMRSFPLARPWVCLISQCSNSSPTSSQLYRGSKPSKRYRTAKWGHHSFNQLQMTHLPTENSRLTRFLKDSKLFLAPTGRRRRYLTMPLWESRWGVKSSYEILHPCLWVSTTR